MRQFVLLFIFFWLLAMPLTGQSLSTDGSKVSNADAPMTVGIVVDNSGSFRMILERVIKAATAIIDDLRPDDESFLLTFVDTAKIRLRQEMTRDKADLRDAAENMFVEGGPTAILDAIVYASKYSGKNASDGHTKILVLITDGDDRENAASVEDAVKTAKAAGIRIFVLGLHEEKFYSKTVDRLIRETGGAKFVPKAPKEAPAAVADLLAAIRGN